MRIVSLDSYGKWNMLYQFEDVFVLIAYLSSALAFAVNNAQETSRFPDASVFLNPVKTTVDLQNRLHHPPLSRLVQSLHPSLPIQHLLHLPQRSKLYSLAVAILLVLFSSAKEIVTMMPSVMAIWFASNVQKMNLYLVAQEAQRLVQTSALYVQQRTRHG